MKVLQNVIEVQEEGLLALIGNDIEVWCGAYIYAGRLVGVNDTCIKLSNPHVVYETGELTAKKYKDAQKTGTEYWYLMQHSIESFGKTIKLS